MTKLGGVSCATAGTIASKAPRNRPRKRRGMA